MVIDILPPADSLSFAAPYPLWKHLTDFSQDVKNWEILGLVFFE